MEKIISLLLITLTCALAFPIFQNENQEEANDEEFIESMYKKEIEEGDNAEEPIKTVKHHTAKKKHLYGHYGYGHGHISEPYGLGMGYPVAHVHEHGPIGIPVAHHGYGLHHGCGHGYGVHHGCGHGHAVMVSPGHGPPLPIKFPPPEHPVVHPHMGEYMPYPPGPFAMPLCVMDKDDDDKKKDDKKKDDKKEKDKKSKKQLIPCHYYGPPGAGWGAFTPGHTGAGWGAPYWY